MINEYEIISFYDHVEEGVERIDVEIAEQKFRPRRCKHVEPASMVSCKYFK